MNIWLDDERNPADHGKSDWTWIKTAEEAISLLKAGIVENISLDHDLGTELTGYDVAAWIERAAFDKNVPPLAWFIHTANPVGRKRMIASLEAANRFWTLYEA
jgi:hypothetical protein